MRGNRSKARSRMANYQSSSTNEPEPQETAPANVEPNSSQEEPDKLDIVFDLNDMMDNFQSPPKEEQQRKTPLIYNTADPFAEVEYDENAARQDNSGFVDQEEIQIEHNQKEDDEEEEELELNFDIKPTVPAPSKAKAYTEDAAEKFFLPTLDLPNENKPIITNYIPPVSSNNYSPAPTTTTTANSYANYQISSAARAGNKRNKPNMANRNTNRVAVANKKPDILAMDDGDIGEVGEWVGKSANINAKKKDEDDEDDDDDEQQNNDEDDFDGVFDQPSEAMLKAKAKTAANNARKAAAGKAGEVAEQFDEEEEEARESVQQAKDNVNNLASQSNLAMQKAQQSALRTAKNKGPFMNSLKDKAKSLQTKTQQGLADGEIKLKESQQKMLGTFDENTNEDEEDDEGAQRNKKTESSKDESSVTSTQVDTKTKIDNKQSPAVVSSEKASPIETSQQGGMQMKGSTKKQEMTISNEKTSPEYVQEDEWDVISKANLQQINQKGVEVEPKLIEFSEAWSLLKNRNLSDQKTKVQQELQRSQSMVQKFVFSCARGNLPASLLEERNQILALAKVDFNDEDSLCFDMLQTVYNKLTGKKTQPPRFGTHWEVIGFQGTDPATDLRGVGVLGLLQLVAFVSYHEKLFKKMFEHSRHETYNFPLAICGFSMTLSAMETLRAGKMNSTIIANKSVMQAFNDFYFAGFFKLYSVYEQNKYTIAEYPQAKAAAVDALKANPVKLLLEFKKYCTINE